jgi:hypothetical protein
LEVGDLALIILVIIKQWKKVLAILEPALIDQTRGSISFRNLPEHSLVTKEILMIIKRQNQAFAIVSSFSK